MNFVIGMVIVFGSLLGGFQLLLGGSGIDHAATGRGRYAKIGRCRTAKTELAVTVLAPGIKTSASADSHRDIAARADAHDLGKAGGHGHAARLEAAITQLTRGVRAPG